jgi:hypothetical protein
MGWLGPSLERPVPPTGGWTMENRVHTRSRCDGFARCALIPLNAQLSAWRNDDKVANATSGTAVSAATDRDAATRARIKEHWAASERGDGATEQTIYAADAILDYPQSGERFTGREGIQSQRDGNPADRHFALRRIRGGGDLWVSEVTITYDGAPSYSVSIMEFVDGQVAHETQYFADPFPAPASRAAIASPIPADER